MAENAIYQGGCAYQQLRKMGHSESNARLGAQQAKIASYSAGEVIDAHSEHYWRHVVDGIIAVVIRKNPRTPSTFAVHESGAWFSEYIILSKSLAIVEFVALQSTDVLQIPSFYLIDWFENEPIFALAISKMVFKRAARIVEMTVLLKRGESHVKVFAGMFHASDSLNQSQLINTTDIPEPDQFNIPLTQTIIADICGVSRTKYPHYIIMLMDSMTNHPELREH